MNITLEGGLVTITLAADDAKAFAILVRCGVDNQETMEADQLGVEPEELTLCVEIAEAMDKRFEELGFHAFALDHNDDHDDHMLDYAHDPAFDSFEMNGSDRTTATNLRIRWGQELQNFDDKTLAYTHREFSLSDMHGDNDARFLEWCGIAS